MFALVRLSFIGFVVMTIVYICLSLYSRAKRRDKLEKAWLESAQSVSMSEYVDEGLRDYDGSLRRKLILGVYVVPTLVVIFIIYATNFW